MDTTTLYSKLSTVPQSIKIWLGSDEVVDYIGNSDARFTLPGGSSTVISKTIQRLQIKDLAPEYFAGELASELSIDKDKAIHITAEIKKTIFAPHRADFASYGINIDQLDKFQMPVIKNIPAPAPTGPAIIQDINTTKATPVIVPSGPITKVISAPTNAAISRSVNSGPVIKTTAIPASGSATATGTAGASAAAPKTNRLSDVGWSNQGTSAPVIKLDISEILQSKSIPKPPQNPAPISTPKPTTPTSGAVSEFDRLNAMRKNPNAAAVPAPTASAPTASQSPAPFMLHQDTSSAAAPKNAEFKIPQVATSADMHLSSAPKAPTPIKPAVLEFGQTSKPYSIPTPTPRTSGGAVHYTQFRPSLSEVPTQSSGPRQVSQIVASAQSPAKSLTTPASSIPPVPRPPLSKGPSPSQPVAPVPVPQPPGPQRQNQPAPKTNIIVKDFI